MKNYLIVGGSSGIGLHLAKTLALAGNKVQVLSRSWKEAEIPQNITFCSIDITEEVVQFPEITEPVDGLIYCPGSINLRPFRALKQADFMNDLQINYLGAAICYILLIVGINYFIIK